MLSPANPRSLLPNLTTLAARYKQPTKAAQTVTPAHAYSHFQQSLNTPVTAKFESSASRTNFKDHSLTEAADKICTSLRHSLQVNNLPAASQPGYKAFCSDLIRSKLTQLAEKFLSCTGLNQQPIDSVAKKIDELPAETQNQIWQEPGCRLAYWQAKTMPTAQNRQTYFLYDKNNQIVLDERNQPMQDVRYRYHLLAHRDIPLDYQLQILASDAQFHTLFCNPQFRQNLLDRLFNRLFTQLTQEPLKSDLIDASMKECVLLLSFLRTKEETPLEECHQIIEIFQHYLAQAQPDTVEQALMELVQYLPCLLKFGTLQTRVIGLVKDLSEAPDNQPKPAWIGPVWANVVLRENVLPIQAFLLAKTWAAQYEPQIIEYLQQIIKRLQAGVAQSTELIMLTCMRKHLEKHLLQAISPAVAQDQPQQIIKRNLPMLREEIQSLLQVVQEAPHRRLGSLITVLQLRDFFTEAQQDEAVTIIKKNVKKLPKALWLQLLPFLRRVPSSNMSSAIA